MKIFSNFIPQHRFENRLASLKDKAITIFNDYPPKTREELEVNPINIFICNEPNEFFGIHDWVIKNHELFTLVLTWSRDVLFHCPNAVLFHHGDSNLDKNYCLHWNNFYVPNDPFKFMDDPGELCTANKYFEVSFLRGILNKIEGHHLRHRIFDKENEIKVPHKWWPVLSDFNYEKNNRPDGADLPNGNPIEGEGKKEVWNRNSMFHVAVENSQHQNYFTDKIVDCFATKTIPIYWGAPNIGDFYDPKGIITFKNENELIEIVNNLTADDYYLRLEAIESNYKWALEDGNYFKRMEKWLTNLCKYNEL
jgi:hypothetical protein